MATATTSMRTDRCNREKERVRERERRGAGRVCSRATRSSLGALMQYARDPGFDNKGSLMQARQVCVYANKGEEGR